MKTYRELFNEILLLLKEREKVIDQKEKDKINEKIDDLNNQYIRLPAILLTLENVEEILKTSKKLNEETSLDFNDYKLGDLIANNLETNGIKKKQIINLLNKMITLNDENEIKKIKNEALLLNYLPCNNESYYDEIHRWWDDFDLEDNEVGRFMEYFHEDYFDISYINDFLNKIGLKKIPDNYFEMIDLLDQPDETNQYEEDYSLYLENKNSFKKEKREDDEDDELIYPDLMDE